MSISEEKSNLIKERFYLDDAIAINLLVTCIRGRVPEHWSTLMIWLDLWHVHKHKYKWVPWPGLETELISLYKDSLTCVADCYFLIQTINAITILPEDQAWTAINLLKTSSIIQSSQVLMQKDSLEKGPMLSQEYLSKKLDMMEQSTIVSDNSRTLPSSRSTRARGSSNLTGSALHTEPKNKLSPQLLSRLAMLSAKVSNSS